MSEIELLQRRIARERKARLEAESILEKKAQELWEINQELKVMNTSLEATVQIRTKDLEINQLRLSKLISNLQNGVLVEDENGTVVLANEKICSLFAIEESHFNLIGKTSASVHALIGDLFSDEKKFRTRTDKIVQEKKHVFNEEIYLENNAILERDFVPVFLGDKYLGHLWMYRDVTEKRLTTEQLRQSEEKYRGIIENMELGLLEVDNEGFIVRAYDRFCAMLGYSPAELIGQNASEILLPSEFLPIVEQQSKDRLTGKAGIYEIQLRSKSGEIIWAMISGAPILSSDGNIIGSIGIHYDVTNQKKLQEELLEAKRRAEEAEELEKQFLANMSHEMRTPLNAIVGMAHLLYDTNPSEEQKEYLSALRSSSDLLLSLVTDVLDLSKIRSGNVEISCRPFDLGGLVRSLYSTFKIHLQNSPVELYCEIDPQLDTLIDGDELLINQILLNLLGNAFKFTKTGRIDLSVQVLERRGADLSIQFVVSDTGIGIPDEKQELIFQAFRQVNGDIKREYGGTGLGLTITKRLVELQNGTIRLMSRVGKGSRFTIELPYKDTGQSFVHQSEGIGTFDQDVLSIHKVLIVEDNAMNRKYICALLDKWDVNYAIAVNGAEGVRMAKVEPYCMIFMDIQMPEMDGYEAAIAIRSYKNLNQLTPIVALTASAMLSNKDKAFEAGMTDYLSKPFTPVQLMEKLARYRQKNKAEVSQIVEIPQNLIDEMYAGDVRYAAEMFTVFLEEMVSKFEELEQHVAAADFESLASKAHQLKPSLTMVGQHKLHDALQKIEHQAKKDLSLTEMRQEVDEFMRAYKSILPQIEAEAKLLEAQIQL